MDKQELVNAIWCLAESIDALNRAGETDAIKKVIKKMLELVEQL